MKYRKKIAYPPVVEKVSKRVEMFFLLGAKHPIYPISLSGKIPAGSGEIRVRVPYGVNRNEERSSSCKWLVLNHKKTEVLFLFEKLIFSDLLINER